jgi:hypothetical protein
VTINQAVSDLLRFHSGRALFVVCDNGALAHHETVVTLELQPGETHESFLRRVAGECRAGDTIELLNNHGKATVARLTRRP